jgi:hypothetical protein
LIPRVGTAEVVVVRRVPRAIEVLEDVTTIEVDVDDLAEVMDEVLDALEVLEVLEWTEVVVEAVLATDTLVEVEVAAFVEVVVVVQGGSETVWLKSYTSSLLGPPQNSEWLPLQSMLQPDKPSGARVAPFWMALPHPAKIRQLLVREMGITKLTAFTRVLCTGESISSSLTSI